MESLKAIGDLAEFGAAVIKNALAIVAVIGIFFIGIGVGIGWLIWG